MTVYIGELAISSPDFANGERMADEFAQDKGNVQPRLTIRGVPKGTVELAIICHDPDAPLPFGFTHWTLWGIPADVTEIGRDADQVHRPGPNGAATIGYIGPQPPSGHGNHHYYFWVYALNKKIEGTPTRSEFLDNHADSIIEQNRLVGIYSNE